MAERIRNNAMYAIPDDGSEHLPLHHRGRQARAAVAERRAPFLPTTSKKPTVTAMEEVRRGLVQYTDSLRVVPEELVPRRIARRRSMNVALGVGGGIAAYKAAELARALMERGMRVQVVMTGAAREFITPLTFASLTGRKVITGLFCAGSSEDTLSSAIEHIRVAQENEILVIAPATADLLAKSRARPGRRFSDHHVSGVHRPRGAGAGDEHQHVESSGHAGESARAAQARPRDRRAGRRAAGLRHDRPGTLGRAGADRRCRWPASNSRSARSGRRDRSDHGRSHAGAARSGSLHLQPIQRQDGLRAGGSGGAARRARDPGFRTGAPGGAARRARGACAHRARNARGGDGALAAKPPSS